MTDYRLRLELESAATFGRGSGIPGLVDQDIVLDDYGCPYLHGRTFKGLLSEVCSEILYGLASGNVDSQTRWNAAADRLFGIPGSTHESQGIMRIGHARLPSKLRKAIRHAVDNDYWTKDEVTESLTAIRQQTALEVGGSPDPHTLRAIRVILRETVFHAELTFRQPADDTEKALLAACIKGLRRAGLARNRGRGRVTASIEDCQESTNVTAAWFTLFREEFGA